MSLRNLMTIRLLITGGTIDKQYNELNGELIFTQSGIEDMLAQGRAKLDIAYETVMLKDSLDMDDNDRQQILKSCLSIGCSASIKKMAPSALLMDFFVLSFLKILIQN